VLKYTKSENPAKNYAGTGFVRNGQMLELPELGTKIQYNPNPFILPLETLGVMSHHISSILSKFH